jgi:serine/threonine protein kinase
MGIDPKGNEYEQAFWHTKQLQSKVKSVEFNNLLKLCVYIEKTLKQPKFSDNDRWWRRSLTGLCAPFHIGQDMKVYVHFKQENTTICYNTLELVKAVTYRSFSRMGDLHCQKEKIALEKIEGRNGVIRCYDIVIHESLPFLSEPHCKTTFIFKEYNKGTLASLKTRKEKHLISIIKGILQGLATLHKIGICHSNLKKEVIFVEKVYEMGSKVYKAVISDFKGMEKKSEEEDIEKLDQIIQTLQPLPKSLLTLSELMCREKPSALNLLIHLESL